MSALVFSMKHRSEQRVDMSPLVCNKLAGKSPSEIAAMLLQNGKNSIRVDEIFNITGSDTQNIIIEHSFGKLDFIGKDMEGGSISVEGDCGAYLAMGMKAGQVKVLGDASLFAACEMRNGYLEINGNAGDFIGAALPGNKKGMCGGTVLVKGNVGERAGDHMRRGILLIEGDAGDYCGSRMVAGTIAVMGNTGKLLGYAMRRGTILLWKQPQLSVTFNDCGSHTLSFLPVMFSSFKNLNSKFADNATWFNRAQRFGGDIAVTGRGEVLVKI